MDCCIELYSTYESAHNLLDRGKPKQYRNAKNVRYLFLRPDLILTDKGFCLCEIETSPFGLGLAEILNRAYGNKGYNTAVYQNQLKNYVQPNIGNNGTIAYSDNVKSFSGQLDFMAKEIFSGNGKMWDAQKITSSDISSKEIYRAFYLSDQFSDDSVAKLLRTPHIYLPSSTPQFEEKALLSFIWDKRYKEFFMEKLGNSSFDLLRRVIPKTWVLGEEKYVDGGLPEGKEDSLGLASLSKKNRQYVLKQSRFSTGSSWGEGVKFLHKMGGGKALEYIKLAMDDSEHLYIIQEFNQGNNHTMTFLDNAGNTKDIDVRIRLTPYFAYMGRERGKLIAAKVTGCENTTEYIHASTSSINTAVSYDER